LLQNHIAKGLRKIMLHLIVIKRDAVNITFLLSVISAGVIALAFFVFCSAGSLYAASGRTHVVAIGIAKYNDPAISGTGYADADAHAFGELWRSKELGDIPKNNIHILVNKEATRSNIEKAIKNKLSMSLPQDRVYIFFAGHGDTLKMPAGNTITALLPYDTELGNVKTCYVLKDLLYDLKKYVPAKKGLLIMDCCHSGAAGSIRGINVVPGITASGESKEVKQFLDERSQDAGYGWGVLTACRPEEKSRSTDKYQHGFFTFWLKYGLLGLADQKREGHVGNDDGKVTFSELQRFVYDRVVKFTRGTQHPVSSGLFHPETEMSRVGGMLPVVPGLDEFISVVALKVQPTDAEILCDGKIIPPSNALRGVEILPGKHSMVIKREGFHSISFLIELEEGQRYERKIKLKRKTRPGFQAF